MRRMATGAALLLHWLMLEYKGPHGIAVTLRADRKLACRSPHLTSPNRAMWIMTIAALHQSHIHPMPVGTRELCLLLRVASVAQNGLFRCKQKLGLGCMMRRVTSGTTNTVRRVGRAAEIHVLEITLMTLQAALAGLRCAQLRKANNLGDVPAAGNMFRPCPVAILASMPPLFFQQRVMRCPFKVLVVNLFVAAFAGI